MVSDYLPGNLRLCRIRKGLRQEDMAKQLNIGRQAYCNYENGQRMPDPDTLVEISKLLNVSLDVLLRQKMQ